MKLTVFAALLAFGMAAPAQIASPSLASRPTQAAAPAVTPPPDVTPVLAQIESSMQRALSDLGRLRVNKWKTDSQQKQEAESNAASLQRNMQEALPGLIAQVRSDPQNVGNSFKLYRNLNALHDVISSLTESAGAFGPKEEFQALAADVNDFDTARRTLADHVERLATFTQAQLTGLRAEQQQIRAAAAAAAAAPPRKIIVDDETPKKKTTRKKKPAPATPTQQSGGQPQP